jgi:His/Glu/Gln/Arg/opine family amino acid ABC transporter permease subunit
MHFDPRFVLSVLPELLKGLQFTFWLVLVSSVLGIVIGLGVCFGKLYATGFLNRLCRVYVVVVRGIPEIVVMFWVYYCCPLVLDARPSGFVSAAIAMALYSGAMLAEVFRAGIQAVPAGQHQAAKALGLPSLWLWLEIIGPQALRTMIPALLGLLSLQIKVSGIASAIGVGELVYTTTILSGQSFRYFELFTTVGLIYFAIIFALSALARAYELRLRNIAQ